MPKHFDASESQKIKLSRNLESKIENFEKMTIFRGKKINIAEKNNIMKNFTF